MNVTGKLPEKRLADVVEGLFVTVSWPDPRIWCNKIGVFNAMTRSSIVAAITSGGLAGDSRLYGPGSFVSVGPFFFFAYKHIVVDNESIESFIENFVYRNGGLYAPGFARPLAKGDERVPAMRRLVKELGYDIGPYSKMVIDMEDYLNKKDGEGANLAGFLASFLKDQGFTLEEIIGVTALCVTGGIYATYFEYINQPPESFLPLRVEDIEYIGPTPRAVPNRIE